MKYVVAYLTALATLFVVELVWLGIVAKSFYREQIGSLMLDQITSRPPFFFMRSSAKGRSVAGSRPLRRATRSRMKARRTGLS